MPVKIRLARHGRKRRPYYYIIVADSRSPRDGRFIERLGSYNPNSDPATIILDFEKALDWVIKGAQPTDTVRSILSREGVMLKKHLLEGVKKGAFDEAEAERRFENWKKDKEQRLVAAIEKLKRESETERNKRIEAETKVKETRAEAIAAKYVVEEEKEVAEKEEETETTENKEQVVEKPVEETPKEEPKAEEPKAEEPKAEESKEEEPKEEPKAEETESKEEPKEEPKDNKEA
ncbi:MAG: 30S ribosomal protein S16 [Bacteroidales bacterium]|jgi:small subunit ribosomal protein S16|nr:30S ribosomal protein S16 [Bacteroidales bacterium]